MTDEDHANMIADQIMDMSQETLIETVKEGIRGRYTLHLDVIDVRVLTALRILAFDIMTQDKYLLDKHRMEDFNEEAGKKILSSFFDELEELYTQEGENDVE
tara:strand:- start:433 stop:738 length:306 start_codon:yes stop_codon:yes gene_type:complete